MIVYHVADTASSSTAARLVMTTQPDHAIFASDLLSLWRSDGLPTHPRRSELLFAVREHDNGWREPDAAPSVDPETGAPYDFRSYPNEHRTELWSRAVDRFAADHPYPSLLIAHHTLELHQPERRDPAWQDFFRALDRRYQALLDRVAGLPSHPPEARPETRVIDEEAEFARQLVLDEVRTDYVWLELTDLMSLALCNGWAEEYERHGVRFRIDQDRLGISPFPLAGATTFHIRCREIPDRPYDSDTDLTLTLVEARWRKRSVRVVDLADL